MKDKKSNILIFALLSCAACIGVVGSIAICNTFKPVSADKIYEINFSGTHNKLDTKSGSSTDIYTNLGSKYSMNQTDLNTQFDSEWASFQKDATFWIEEKVGYTWDNAFVGLKTLKINFDKAEREFKIYFSKDGTFNENYSRKYVSKEGENIIDFEGHPHYFKFEALDVNRIYSMTITYSCSTEEDAAWNASHGVTYTAQTATTVTYGLFPQTHVNDSTLIEALTKKVDELNINDEEYFWYNDEYYVKDTCNPYDYGSWSDIRFSDGTSVNKGDVNFFKCEPIEWNLKKYLEDEKRIIDCTNILYGYMFATYSYNYSGSELREWLNDGYFLNKAFFLKSSNIVPTNLDDVSVTGDKVWVASKDQISTWYPESSARPKKVCDFALSNKAFMSVNTDRNGYYWTRTADTSLISNDYAFTVNHEGSFMGTKVSNDYEGVSPSLTIKK